MWATLQERVNSKAIQAFGRSVVLDGVTITADFLTPTDELFLEGVSAMAQAPQLQLKTSDVPVNPVGKTVIVDAKTYRIAEIANDGHGLTRCLLEVVL